MSGLDEKELTKEQKAQIAELAKYNADDVAAVKNFIARNDAKAYAAYKENARDADGNPRELQLQGMEVQGYNIGGPGKAIGEHYNVAGKWDFRDTNMQGVKLHDISFAEAHLPDTLKSATKDSGTKDFERFEAVLENVVIRNGSIKNLEGVVITGDTGLVIGGGDKPFDMREANLQNLKFRGYGARITTIGDIDTTGAYIGGEAKHKGQEILEYDPQAQKDALTKREQATVGTKEWNTARTDEVDTRERNTKITDADRNQFDRLMKKAPGLVEEYGKDNNKDVEPLKNIKGVSPEQLAAIANRLPEADLQDAVFAAAVLSKAHYKPEPRQEMDGGSASKGLTLGQQIAIAAAGDDHVASMASCASSAAYNKDGKGGGRGGK